MEKPFAEIIPDLMKSAVESLLSDDDSHKVYFSLRLSLFQYLDSLESEAIVPIIKELDALLEGSDLISLLVPNEYTTNLAAVLIVKYASAVTNTGFDNVAAGLDTHLLPQHGSLQARARKLLLGFFVSQLEPYGGTLNGLYRTLSDMFGRSESDVKRAYQEYIKSDFQKEASTYHYHFTLLVFGALEFSRKNWRMSSASLEKCHANEQKKLTKAYKAYDKWRLETILKSREKSREMLLSDDPFILKFMDREFIETLLIKDDDFTNEEAIAILMICVFLNEADTPASLRNIFGMKEPVSKPLT